MMALDFGTPGLESAGNQPGDLLALMQLKPDEVLQGIESELVKIRARISECSLHQKYLDLVLFSQGGPTKAELNEIRLYCLTELQRILDRDMNLLVQGFISKYRLNEHQSASVGSHLDAANKIVLKKIGDLVSMESIGYAHFGKNTQFKTTGIPSTFRKYGKELPELPVWNDLYELIEYIGLLMVQKEFENGNVIVTLLKGTNTRALAGILQSVRS